MDWNPRLPIVGMTHLTPWQSAINTYQSLELLDGLDLSPKFETLPEARVFTLMYLLHQALEHYTRNDAFRTRLLDIFAVLPSCSQTLAKNVL